jgi:hypothetical protein
LIGAGDFGAAAGGVEGERGDEVGGFGGGGFEAGELGGGDVDLGAGAGEVGVGRSSIVARGCRG